MCTARARFHPVKIRADIVPRQVQHLAPELPIFLDLRLALRRSPSELAVCIARRRDPPHRRFESRVLEIEVNPKLRAWSECPYAIMSIPSTAAISSTFSRPSSDSIDGHIMMFSLARGAYSVAWRAP